MRKLDWIAVAIVAPLSGVAVMRVGREMPPRGTLTKPISKRGRIRAAAGTTAERWYEKCRMGRAKGSLPSPPRDTASITQVRQAALT